MNSDARGVWTMFRLALIFAFVALVLSILAVSFLGKGLTATRGAQQLQDSGVVASVTDVRIHVVHIGRTSSTNSSPDRYRVNAVEVVFTDPQGQDRAERLSAWSIRGDTPRSVGWTTQFEDHDNFVGKEVLFLPDRSGQAQMRDQVLSTLAHGYEPAPTYIGIGAAVLALLALAVSVKVAIGKVSVWRRQGSGIA